MKVFEIIDAKGNRVAEITAIDVRFIQKGVGFQPILLGIHYIFNAYHAAIDLGGENPTAVLNIPEGWSLRRVT